MGHFLTVNNNVSWGYEYIQCCTYLWALLVVNPCNPIPNTLSSSKLEELFSSGPIYNPGQKSLGQYCNIHIFLSLLGSLLKQCILFESFLQFSLPPPYTKLKLRKNSGYTHPTLFVGGGVGPVWIGKKPRNASVPRLLSMIIVCLHLFIFPNTHLSTPLTRSELWRGLLYGSSMVLKRNTWEVWCTVMF